MDSKSSKSASANAAIDILKLLLSIMVVAVHTVSVMSYSGWFEYAFLFLPQKAAIGCFFAISSYLYFNGGEGKRISSYCLRILYLYIIWHVIYLLIYLPFWATEGRDVSTTIWWYIWNQIILAQSGHLWYLHASIVGMIVFTVMRKVFRCEWIVFSLSALLFAVGLLGDTYSVMNVDLPGGAIYQWYFEYFENMRNGFFFAPIFFWIGYKLSDQTRVSVDNSVEYGVIAVIIMLFEALVISYFGLPKDWTFYCFLPFTALALVELCIYLSWIPLKNTRVLRHLSTLIYLIHPAVIYIFDAELISMPHALSAPLQKFATILFAAGTISMGIYLASGKLNILRRLY